MTSSKNFLFVHFHALFNKYMYMYATKACISDLFFDYMISWIECVCKIFVFHIVHKMYVNCPSDGPKIRVYTQFGHWRHCTLIVTSVHNKCCTARLVYWPSPNCLIIVCVIFPVLPFLTWNCNSLTATFRAVRKTKLQIKRQFRKMSILFFAVYINHKVYSSIVKG
jgi:hypothetical protein